MARTGQRIAIAIAVSASFIAYLFHAPNSEGVEQVNRIRGLAATMKLTQLLVRYAYLFQFDNIC